MAKKKKASGPKGKTKASPDQPTKHYPRFRSRHTPAELVVIAGQIAEYIKGMGKEGASAKDITAKFPQFGQFPLTSPNAWLKRLKKYSPVKVKTVWQKSEMRCFA